MVPPKAMAELLRPESAKDHYPKLLVVSIV